MSSAIEETVKALVGFESQLDRAKVEASEAKRRAMKDATDWAEAAKAAAVSKAQEIASGMLVKARAEADAEAAKIREKGESDLRAFEGLISKHKAKAAEIAAAGLLGENS